MSECREKDGVTANYRVHFSSRIAVQIADAVEKAMTTRQLDDLYKLLCRAYCDTQVSFHEVELIDARIQALRAIKKAAPYIAPATRRKLLLRPRNPDERIARRRRIAACGAIPATLAVHYTPHQLAVVSAIVSLLRQNRLVEKTLQEIADIAGVCRKTVQRALRLARSLNHLHVEERRVAKDRSLPHRVSIGSDLLLRRWISCDGDQPYRRGWVTGQSTHTKQSSNTPSKRPIRPNRGAKDAVLLNRGGSDETGLVPTGRSKLLAAPTAPG